MLPPLNHNKSMVTNNYILYYIVGANCVRPFLIRCELAGDRRSPLRFNVFFNLTTPDYRHISDNSLGRSKPLPYIVGCYFSLRAKHPLLFTLHSSLPVRLIPTRILYQITFVFPPHRRGGCHFFAEKNDWGSFYNLK